MNMGHKNNDNLKEDNVIKSIRATRKLPDGVYIRGSVQGYPLLFTTDTGASKTIISKRIYDTMREDDRPQLGKSSKLVGASGNEIHGQGKGLFSIMLGAVQLETEAIVADIDDDGLLGVDVLQNGVSGPTDLLLSKGVLKVHDQEVPIIRVGIQNRIRKVTAADHFVIPAQCESVVNVYVERQEYDDFTSETEYLIEPTDHFKETYPLCMASTLVDINKACTCKVRILNPFPTAMSIKQDAVVGQAEAIQGRPKILAEQENKEDIENFCRVRRVDFMKTNHELSNRSPGDEYVGTDKDTTYLPEHLKQLHDRATKDLDDVEKQKVTCLLNKFKDIFSKGEWDLGLTHLAEHAINTGNADPIKQAPRRVPLAYAEKEKQAIEELKAKGVIRESVSPWASPIVLVSKKDGGVRPCVDYRKVNELVKPDGFPLPRIQDCLDAVAGSSLFSTFDLTSGYFQIPLKEEDIPKSAFVCKYGHFEMTGMPFGLNNSASTFQRTMEMALQGLQWITCLIYIDDIIVFGRTFEEHVQRIGQVFERIREAGLKLKPAKCNMFEQEVIFLGHVVSGEGVRPSPVNITKILDWPEPRTAKQVKQFVAMGSYYRRYVRDFASMVRPMTELTKKGKQFLWTETCQKSFEQLKKALVSSDVMGYPLNDAGEFILDVDASDIGIGGILHQIQEGRERVIAYASRALNKAERNYCITEKELLAVRFFIEYYRQYLLGRRFVVRTDHQALVWLFKLKEPRGKTARWIEILSQYDFAIEYRPGRKQAHCDALSRCEHPRECDCPNHDTSEPLKCGPCRKCLKRAEDMLHESIYQEIANQEAKSADASTETPVELRVTRGAVQEDDEVPGPSTQSDTSLKDQMDTTHTTPWTGGHSIANLKTLQSNDPDISPILEAKAVDVKPSSSDMVDKSPATRHYWIIWDLLFLKNGLLYKKFVKKDGSGEHQQLVVPKELKNEVLFQMHNSVVSGHLGCKKTKEKTIQRFYWYGLKEDVLLYIRKCDFCAADKKPNKMPRAPMGSLRSGAPLDCVATDYLGPFPVTDRENRYILLLTDHFSKYVEIIAVPDMTAEVCASSVLNEFISRWGCPLTIHSDQGRTYESKVFKELCRMLEIRKSRTSVRNPRGNGQSERFNRTLLRMIKAYLCGEQKQWDRHLGCLAGAYRATPNEATKMTPNLMTMGREVRLPAELVFGSTGAYQEQEITSYGDYVDKLRSRMQHAHEIARNHLASAAKRSKGIYDTKVALNRYETGDMVWCLAEARKVGVMPKLEPAYDGPYLIKRKISEINFLLQLDKTGKEKLVHHNKLKPYVGDIPPSWLKKAKKKLLLQKN